MTEVDLLIVGAGPAGLYAAYYAGFRGLSTAIVDSLPEPGGQLTALYPEKPIYDVAGFPGVRSRDLVAALVEQAAAHGPTFLLGRRAEELHRAEDGFGVQLDDGSQLRCRTILVTAGLGTFSPRALPAAADWVGRGVEYVVRDLDELAGLDVLIVGGGDSAVDWALALVGSAKSVTLTHRRTAFRAHAASVAALQSSDVRVMVPCEVDSISGSDRVEAAVVRNSATDEATEIPVQAVVAALGFIADLGPLTRWGMQLDRRRHVLVDTHMATSVPGVYSAGDVVEYPGKVRLISVGFGEAATAVNNAAVYLDPSAHVFPGHSSAGAVAVPA